MKKILKNVFGIIGGALIGFVNGFFGGGGGMLCVPLLEKILDTPPKMSHATAIPIILPITIASACVYVFGGFSDWNATAFTSIGVAVGGIVGALILAKLKSTIAEIIFAGIMIVAGIKSIIG